MKKVLIITYYWPPAGGPGVQRVLKFAKYLPEFGWTTLVLTVKDGEYPAIDKSWVKEIPENCKIFKTKSLEPNTLYRKFVGIHRQQRIPVAILAEKNLNWKKKFANWIRINCFIPDAKIGWKHFAIIKGKEIIEEFKPDLILSSSPPPTVHLIAKNLAKYGRLKWVADFRDPWTDIYYYQNLNKNRITTLLDKFLEKSVLHSADKISTVSNDLAKLFNEKYPSDKITIVPNGFDTDDFLKINTQDEYDKFTLAYAGKLNNQQNPVNLWAALESLIKTDKQFANDFKLIFMGNFSQDIYRSIENHNLKSYFIDLGSVDHGDAIINLNKAHIKLLIIPDTEKNKGILTGKLFDYLATDGFVLGLGPQNGDAAQILKETGAGQMFEFSDNLKNIISEHYQKWKKGIRFKIDNTKTEKYTRKNLAKKMANIFEELVLDS